MHYLLIVIEKTAEEIISHKNYFWEGKTMKKAIYWILILFLFNNVFSQKLHIKNYSTDDGLPTAQIWCTLQDSKGYMWFGTTGGLVKYNGKQFKNFSVIDGLCNNIVRSLLEDKNGNLWITTNGGISCFDGNNFKNYTAEEEIGTGIVWSIIEHQEYLWFGTMEKGLSRFDGKNFVNYNTENGLPGNNVYSLLSDGQYLWIGTRDGGLSRFDGKSFTNYGKKEGIPAKTIGKLVKKNSTIWICTRGSGLFKYENSRFTKISNLPDHDFYSAGKDEGLWFGTLGNGVWRLKDIFKNYTTDHGLPNDQIYYIYTDRENTVWLNTNNGISKLLSSKFVSYFENEMVFCACEYKDALWFGTSTLGLAKLKDNKFTYYTIEDGLLNNQIWDLAVFKDKLWIGTYTGLNSFDGKKFTSYTAEHGAISGVIFDLEPVDENLWISSRQGALKYDGKKFTVYTTDDGLVSNFIFKICRDENKIWFTSIGGVSCFENNKFTNYTTENGLPSNYVRTVFKDSKGDIWFGTDFGLVKFDPGKSGETGLKLTAFTTRDGLSNNNVASIIEYNGNLFIGTDKGLNIFDGEKVIKVYNQKNGLIGDESTSQNSIFIDKDENIWFGASRGLTKYIPKNDILNEYLMPVYIENFWVNDSLISDQGNLEFEYSKNTVKFSYIGLSFKDEGARYKYKLEGYDKNWSRVTQKTEVRYTNLNDGNYTFKVLAQNGDGYWSEKPAEISFKILPPFWRTWWCILIELIIIILIIYGGFLLKTARIRRRAKVLEQKVDERTAELKETQKTLVDVAHRAGMAEIATGILHNVGNVLNSVKVSSQILREKNKKSKVNSLQKVLDLMEEHKDDMGNYITSDEKGKILPAYIIEVGRALKVEQNSSLEELSTLSAGINHIEEIVNVQQNYAGAPGIVESISLVKIMDDVLRMNQDVLNKHKIKVIKHYDKTQPVLVEKGKLVQIFINLLKNAWESLIIKGAKNKAITINISEDEINKCQIVEIVDTGIGIHEENLKKIFSYGFTTKKNGKGFGLHTSALAISEIKGKITVSSDGEGDGAKFTITVPK